MVSVSYACCTTKVLSFGAIVVVGEVAVGDVMVDEVVIVPVGVGLE